MPVLSSYTYKHLYSFITRRHQKVPTFYYPILPRMHQKAPIQQTYQTKWSLPRALTKELQHSTALPSGPPPPQALNKALQHSTALPSGLPPPTRTHQRTPAFNSHTKRPSRVVPLHSPSTALLETWPADSVTVGTWNGEG